MGYALKSLYLKQKIHIGGPWSSFNFDEVNPEFILSKFYGKAGHPFQMILLLQMDCAIIDECVVMPWMREINHLMGTVDRHTTGSMSVHDIDFKKYDFVMVEDAILDASIIKNNPNTLFAYACAEHFDAKYSDVYDVFLQHIVNQPRRHPNEKFFTFPRDPDTMQKMFDVTNKEGYFLDNRDPDNYELHMPNNNNSPVRNISYYCPGNIIEGESEQYYRNLSKSKYAICLTRRHGQFFHDAASLNTVCIGQTSNNNNYFLHPDMICDSITCVQKKIEILEQNPDYYSSIVNWQLNNINNLTNEFLSTLKQEIENKRENK